MKCKELQIFDWVQDHNGFQWQIKGVGDDYAYATFEGNEGDPWEFNDKDDQPEGIPITREILEKNGWECNGNYMIIKVGNNTLYWVEYLDCGLYKNEYNMCTCKYVHQLQHALRLCGFDVLADTFKI